MDNQEKSSRSIENRESLKELKEIAEQQQERIDNAKEKEATSVAPRPLGSDMSLEKLHATGFTSRDWTEDLKRYIDNESNHTHNLK